MRSPLLPCALVALICGACQEPSLQDATGDLAFTVDEVEMGSAWIGLEIQVGQALEKDLQLVNRGRAAADVRWDAPGAPWSFDPLPTLIPPGTVKIRVRFTPSEPGDSAVVLRARTNGPSATVLLRAHAAPMPACQTPSVCHAVHFDPVLGDCVEVPVDDGTSCDSGSQCVFGSTCSAGQCVGIPVTCDDGNACTLDLCNPLTGCQFQPAPPCPGDGACQVGTCDPKVGCKLEVAEDGTQCGDATCDAAAVCIGGACVLRDPPDGFICQEASPCQGQGICEGSACVRPPRVPLPLKWSSFGPLPPVGHHDFVMEPDGAMTLLGFYEKPVVRANTEKAVTLSPSTARRCILWNGQLACADFREDLFSDDATVALIDVETGIPIWTFDLRTARPEILAQTDALFMARLSSLGSDRIAALYESYPRDEGTATQRRDYFFVILDAKGKLVSAKKIEHPFLKQPQHPHPYGVVSDRFGNLYVSFANSPEGASTPLPPQSPSLLMSFTRHGVERWSTMADFRGGELAIADGVLFPENAPTPYEARTGTPQFAWAMPLPSIGRVVSDGTRWIAGPAPGEPDLFAADMTGGPLWTTKLSEHASSFASFEIRLAAWTARPTHRENVVLTLAYKQGNGIEIAAFRPKDGKEQWSCLVQTQMSPADRPNTFEVGIDTLGLMTSAEKCGRCDPPYSQSNNAIFWEYELAGVRPAVAPWVGTFGGAAHDHREQTVPAAPTGSN